MTNVSTEIKGNKLVITIDVSSAVLAQAQFSKTGKSKIVASTHGFVNLQDGFALGLNVTKK